MINILHRLFHRVPRTNDLYICIALHTKETFYDRQLKVFRVTFNKQTFKEIWKIAGLNKHKERIYKKKG